MIENHDGFSSRDCLRTAGVHECMDPKGGGGQFLSIMLPPKSIPGFYC